MLLIDKILLKFFGGVDWISEQINKLFAPRCKCKKNSKRTYKKEKDHGTDISFENEINHGK
jgi:hypothetical protein|tara:strand:- start:141 stop:323 length:183 start_codon:yes stop_codon:yes gene_type:complete